jgi:hypothetical protein
MHLCRTSNLNRHARSLNIGSMFGFGNYPTVSDKIEYLDNCPGIFGIHEQLWKHAAV